jgi:BirA family transcriptional regulator, biotin operon repressor / biotin---[acetyl-CoA-carboxylase] ligase
MSELQSTADSTATWAMQRRLALISDASTGSTNDDAKRGATSEESDFVLYLAAHQSAGRGRGQNHWLDTGAGESLLSTWSFRMPSHPQAITGPRVGLALFTAAAKTWPSLAWAVKAPNDLFLNGHKVAGLLVESVSSGNEHRLLIGLGMNVLNHPRKFTEATHLADALGARPSEGDWFKFLDELKLQFRGAILDIVKPVLNDSARKDLARALNANPHLKDKLIEISPEGDLHFGSGKIRWTDL